MLDADLFFDFDLHRKSVGVPSRLPMHLISAHGLVPAERILQRPRHHMVNSRFAVCRGRAFVKCIERFSLAGGNASVEDIILFPEFQNFFFDCRVLNFVCEFFKHVITVVPLLS